MCKVKYVCPPCRCHLYLFIEIKSRKHKQQIQSKIDANTLYQIATYGLIIDLKVTFKCRKQMSMHTI